MKTIRSVILSTALALVVGTGCAEDVGDDEDVDDVSEEIRSDAAIRVVQLNAYYSGVYPPGERRKAHSTPPRTYGTVDAFVTMLAANDPNTAVIGMEEAEKEASEVMTSRLAATMQVAWNLVYFPSRGVGNDRAIFYRPDIVTLVENFDSRTVELIDEKTGPDYAAQFSGALFEKNGPRHLDRRFGVFVGKLTWKNAMVHGHRVTHADRVHEFEDVLQPWIQEKMAPWPHAARIITMDMNDSYGSDVHDAIMNIYGDGGAKEHTGGGKRLDYVFWDEGAGRKGKKGFLAKPRVSSDFGSDHRYVSALVRVDNVRSPSVIPHAPPPP